MPSSSSPQAAPASAAASSAAREVRITTALVTGALLLGTVLQVFVPPGALSLVVASALAGAVVIALAFLVPGRIRETIAGFRFTSTLLVVLAVFAIGGTLILQGKDPSFYAERYPSVAPLIVALRLDDIFHGLPFALLMALFGAGVVASATLRWPVKARNAGFFVCHVGLFVTLAGAAASTLLAKRGMVWLPEQGDPANAVMIEKGHGVGAAAPLGFDIELEKFILDRYHSEYRIGFYTAEETTDDHGHKQVATVLKTSFDACDDGVKCAKPDTRKHVLPGGDSFRVKAYYPDYATVTEAIPAATGPAAVRVTVEGVERWLADGESYTPADGRLAVAFGWARPAAPAAQTAILLSGAERKAIVQRADGAAELPLAEGLALLGGAVKVGTLLEHATVTSGHGTISSAWRNPAALVEWTSGGRTREQLVLASAPRWMRVGETAALLFEKRQEEPKAFTSHVTLRRGGETRAGIVTVNDPLEAFGWTFYQNSYRPPEQAGVFYTGLEAVHDPGVAWVFLGFFLICVGVAYMFYVEPRLKGRAQVPVPATVPAKAKAA